MFDKSLLVVIFCLLITQLNCTNHQRGVPNHRRVLPPKITHPLYENELVHVTPIRAVAVFHQPNHMSEKGGGVWSLGIANGSIVFHQPNFPNQQATLVHIQLVLGKAKGYTRKYRIEVLYEGRLDAQYCLEGMRYVEVTDFELLANEAGYYRSLNTNEISVNDEWEGIIGRLLRIICLNCELGKDYLGGCAIIARSEDEVFVERD